MNRISALLILVVLGYGAFTGLAGFEAKEAFNAKFAPLYAALNHTGK